MPLTLGRTASFGAVDQISYPDGTNHATSGASLTTYTFTFTQIYKRTLNTVQYFEGTIAAWTKSLDEVASIPFRSAKRRLIISVGAFAAGGRTVSGVTAQVTGPVAGGIIAATEIAASASSVIPVGVYLVALPPISEAHETIDIVVTMSGACTGCSVSFLMVPDLVSDTPVQAGIAATVSFTTFNVLNNCHLIGVANGVQSGGVANGHRFSTVNAESDYDVRKVYLETDDGLGTVDGSFYYENHKFNKTYKVGSSTLSFMTHSPIMLSGTTLPTLSAAGSSAVYPDFDPSAELVVMSPQAVAFASFY